VLVEINCEISQTIFYMFKVVTDCGESIMRDIKLETATLKRIFLMFAFGIALAPHFAAAAATDSENKSAADRASVAAAAVQTFYDPATGLFCEDVGDCWWWLANELTALIDYSKAAKSQVALADIATTYTEARYRGPQKNSIGPFLDTWTDDDGWWGLAWVDAYDYTKIYDPAHADRYLALSENIFAYMAAQWETSDCGGGLWQNQKPRHTKDAIANELFLSLATSLYRHTGKAFYLDWAMREWTWFKKTGMINSDHLVDDHLASGRSSNVPHCSPQRGQFWTYNQGVILGGLTDLYVVNKTTNPALAQSVLRQATEIADCVTNRNCGGNPSVSKFPILDSRDILTEACGTDPCTYSPAYQFKGIFMRNLSKLNQVTSKYSQFLEANASSVWTRDRGKDNLFGFYWDSPPSYYLPSNGKPAVQGAALDLLTTQIQ
jgi:predicted alpha-1,6-mannanase (GH76 family)